LHKLKGFDENNITTICEVILSGKYGKEQAAGTEAEPEEAEQPAGTEERKAVPQEQSPEVLIGPIVRL